MSAGIAPAGQVGTGGSPTYGVTAGGYRGIPFTMALGEYVTTSSPLLLELPVPVLDRLSAGASLPAPPMGYGAREETEGDDDAGRSLRVMELFFQTHITELLARYEGRFVAMLDNRVIDHDANMDSLMDRVYREFGYRPILIRLVQRKVDRPSRIPSPRQPATGWLPKAAQRPRDLVGLRAEFKRLVDQWERERPRGGDLGVMVLHPAYQRIMAMGSDAVPWLLAELERKPGHWFWALHFITGVNPVPPESEGKLKEMASAWIRWGREQGIQW